MTRRVLDILFVGTLPPHQGGSANSCAEVLKGLIAFGHRVRAVAPVTTETRGQARRWERTVRDLQVRRFDVPFFETEPMHTVPAGYRQAESRGVLRCLEQEVGFRAPDLILVGRETFSLHVMPFAHRMALPVVQRVAGGVVLGIHHGSLPKVQCRRYLEAMTLADRIVVPAKHTGDVLDTHGVPGAVVIPNTVDTCRFQPGPRPEGLLEYYGIPSESPVVAHISNAKAIKRPLDVVRCASQVLRVRRDVTFLFIGDGPLRHNVEQAIHDCGLEDKFRLPGWIPYDQIPEWFRLADIVLVPSQADTQPRVYLETLASGRVLVASDIPAAREILEHGRSALLHPVGDVDTMSKLVLSALEQDDQVECLRASGPYVSRHHTPDKTVVAYDKVLRQAVDGCRLGKIPGNSGDSIPNTG